MTTYASAEIRFWQKVSKRRADQCWNWTGATSNTGYGILSVAGVRTYAHRYSWTFLRGPIPDGLVVDHRCSNRSCVNPAHLEPVSIGENSRRGMLNREACKHGHAYTKTNTYVDPRGKRECRTCRAEARARYEQLPSPQGTR